MNLLRRLLGGLAVLVTVSTALVGLSAGSASAAPPCNRPFAIPCDSTNEFVCWEFPPDSCRVPIRFAEEIVDDGVVYFSTVDGTAVAPKDYEPIRDEVLKVPAGTSEVVIPLRIATDDRPVPDKEFYLIVRAYLGRTVVDEKITIIIRYSAAG
jgi:hypothetical protein